MKVEQIYTGCLAQAAYYIESNGESAIFDPLRDVEPYLARASQNNVRIKYIFETHFHADFVSGHLDLARKTGAEIVFGPNAQISYKARIAEDGEIFRVGSYTIRAIHTPGHTMESTTYLLIDETGKQHGIITGDTLFIGDVGRPDLAQHVVSDLTQEKLAGHLYESLRNKIMPLSDDLIVYPGHGAGSACGKKMSSETVDTLGNQKRTNYALNPQLSKHEFVSTLLHGLVAPPAYFPQNVLLNCQGSSSMDEVLKGSARFLSVQDFEKAMTTSSAVILDTRDAAVFADAFVPGAINIGIKGSFAGWVGTLIPDITQPLLLVSEPDTEVEVITRLARVGYDNTIGFLEGGVEAWIQSGKKTDHVKQVNPDELAELNKNEGIDVLDVRKGSEYESEHLLTAQNVPLDFIYANLHELSPDKKYYVHCAGGYRSMTFISIMQSRGFRNLVNIRGGFAAIKQNTKFAVTEYTCPSALL